MGKLNEILEKTNSEQEINELLFLIDGNLNYENACKIIVKTTSEELFEYLLKYISGPYGYDICRCTKVTDCPKGLKCLRGMLSMSKIAGIYSYANFDCRDENDWTGMIEI